MAFSFGTPAAPAAGTSGTSTFSFGATPAQQQQQQNKPATGGFSFGTPAASQPAASTTTVQAPAAGGGLFGGGVGFGSSQPAAASAAPAAAQAPAASTGGLFSFGANPAASTATSQPQQASTNTFGSTTGGGLFGSSSTTTTNAQAAPAGSGFSFGANTAQQPQPTTSLFGAPASSFATSSAQQPVAQTQFSQQQGNAPAQPDKKLGASLSAQLEHMRAAWDTTNAAGCRFAYYFYNNAGNASNLKHIQGRRPDAVGPMHDQLWAAAVRENPDPNRLYPVLALGFNDLQKRIESQAREAQRQRALLQSLAARLAALEQKHSLSNSVRAQAAQNRQAQLHHRLVALVAKTQLLVPALRGRSISRDEERLIAILEACEAEITGSSALSSRPAPSSAPAASSVHTHPANHARLRARINELWAYLGVMRARREGRSATTEWAVVDPNGLDNVTRILAQQQQGLNHLCTTLETDAKTMDTITSGLTGVKLVGVSR
ncbi:related to NUP57-nuclear pore protein [Sporisorium reilianum SRZ2]|uniref:Related to NUP57-nuclear pore protein n=1 Tax=Sporisorium reilianum (strain SRZ2) TaxID=999809 RepID=E6ZUZ0_SPORE|nr:related to NUP57-nuclear pore protein [Sporisorium reilianum SRZ2]